ncbi:hypothetical protein [uncultured Psychroserpens sp.]|uniref:hypothetical protein n=1 Tax=uncultured Psychroserpens sp. TaxID=255436 RepID=UPI00262F2D7C|nr:hypothetical protein [uncultured Psychroserpens sp.]
MTKSFYVLGFLTFFVLGIGIMFEFLSWPYRGIIVFIGLLLLNFGLIPAYFYQKYRQAKLKVKANTNA